MSSDTFFTQAHRSVLALVLRQEDGQTMAEYALLLTLIVVVTAVVVAAFGSSISSIFVNVTNSF